MGHTTSRRRRADRRAFALLMTLVLIGMAGIMLVGIARHSLTLRERALRAHEDLQQRWATLTLERTVSRGLPGLLQKTLDQAQIRPVPGLPLMSSIQVGSTEYRLIAGDENTKLDLNRLYAVAGVRGLERGLASLGLGDIGAYLPKRQFTGRFKLEAWGQVFPTEFIPPKQAAADWIRTRTGSITLWGDGKLNINRAPDAVIEAIASEAIGAEKTAKLLALRQEEPQLKLKELLDRLDLASDRRSRLEVWLSDRSTCYSLWLSVATSRNRQDRLLVFGNNGEPRARFPW